VTQSRSLSRAVDGRPAAPVRSVHLGLGNFFRAHQCWYTEHASDAAQWGIAAFTGTTTGRPALTGQDCVYTLLARGSDSDVPEVVSTISDAFGADDLQAWCGFFARPELAFASTTVTEAGYCRGSDGGLDLDDPRVASDLNTLRADGVDARALRTAPAKLVLGLMARRAAGSADFAVLPCDNLPENGEVARRVVLDAARAVDPALAGWVEQNVSFVSTMVDRITPRSTDTDRTHLLAGTGIDDPELVVTEPYAEWVISGDFPGGRPSWEDAGARFVDDIVPWEHRKLWLLNGSHSLMAYAASILGSRTVAEAIRDPQVRGWVEQWWDEACRHLPLPAEELAAYREALVRRYANPNIRHQLAQIASDGSEKLPVRIVPIVRAELAAGRDAAGGLRVVAAWIAHLRGLGAPVQDSSAEQVRALANGDPDDAVARILAHLGIDDGAHELVSTDLEQFESAVVAS